MLGSNLSAEAGDQSMEQCQFILALPFIQFHALVPNALNPLGYGGWPP